MSVVIDIDDTLIDVRERLRAAMSIVLEKEVSRYDARNLTTSQAFQKYATEEQQTRRVALLQRLWDILLCEEEIGFDLLSLDEPIPFAAEVLDFWKLTHTIIYLTGRIELTREATLSQLDEFGFPTEDTQLVMFRRNDYAQARGDSIGSTLIQVRSRLFSSIAATGPVLRVVDDFPGYFPVYCRHGVADLVGIKRSNLYSVEDFMDQGATSVIQCWGELKDT